MSCYKSSTSKGTIPRVLSIQSHVVSGYVGNKSATFPMQLLGFDVDIINSVQFSNHTGYKSFKGQVLNDEDLNQLMDGLAENDLDNYTHLLTGYIGSPSFLKQIIKVVQHLKKKNPSLIYVCDPVMGDDGKMYVPETLKDIYKNEIVPIADIMTPNHFELELLLGKKCSTISELKEGIQQLHNRGPQTIALSSTEIDNKLMSIISSIKDKRLIKIEIPKIPSMYTGSGDLYAALILAHSCKEDDIKKVLENTVNSLHDVLLITHEHSLALKDENMQLVKKRELRLIQSKQFIENPSKKLQAKDI